MKTSSAELPPDFAASLIRDCSDAVVYADKDGAIRYWNRAASGIFGFSEQEAMGRSLDLVIPERLRGRHWEGYRKVMGGTPSRYAAGALLAVPALHKDGRQISVEFTILPFHDAAGAILGIAAIMRDATARFDEVRALRREVAALKAQLQKAA